MNVLNNIGVEVSLDELLAKEDEKRGILRLKSVSADKLLEMSLPSPEYIVFPWLRVGQSALLSAKAGIGKTHLMLSVAKIICEAGTLFDGRWSAPFHRNLLYVDGEMAASDMRARMQAIGLESPLFHLASCDMLPPDRPGMNLARQEWREALIAEIHKTRSEIVILDNLATTYRVDQLNQAESWRIMEEFILMLRRMKIATIIVDHEGKGDGGPRGTSAKSDIAYAMLSLRRPQDYSPEQGCRFEVHFTKTRGFSGPDAAPFEVQLCGGEWSVSDVQEGTTNTGGRSVRPEKSKAVQLFRNGKTVKEVSGELGIPERTCREWKRGIESNPHSDFDEFGF